MVWKCKKCGTCCKFVRFKSDIKISDEEKRWFTGHKDCYVEDNNFIIKTKCKYLKDNMCTIQNNKPENCKMGGKDNCVVSRSLWEKIGGER
jgi:Fe-S-cluster containining protein